MGLLRMLIRALFPRPQRTYSKNVVSIHTATSVTVVRQVPARPSVVRGQCWVVDGDTICIDRISIRLSGIDAPELDHPYGKSAKFALIKLCQGQTIRADVHEATSHDRLVATCYLPDGRDLAAEMVKMGLAVDWPKYSGGKYRPLEQPDVRKKLWRCDARQKGRMKPEANANRY